MNSHETSAWDVATQQLPRHMIEYVFSQTWTVLQEKVFPCEELDRTRGIAAWQRYLKMQLMLSYAADIRRYVGNADDRRKAAEVRCKGDILIYHNKILSETREYWIRELSILTQDTYATSDASEDGFFVEHYCEQAEKVRMAALVERIEFEESELKMRLRELQQKYAALSHPTRLRYAETYERGVAALNTALLVTAHQLPESEFKDDLSFLMSLGKDLVGSERWYWWVSCYVYVYGQEIGQPNFDERRYEELCIFEARSVGQTERVRYRPEDIVKNPRPDMGVAPSDITVMQEIGWYEKFERLAWNEPPTDEMVDGFLAALEQTTPRP